MTKQNKHYPKIVAKLKLHVIRFWEYIWLGKPKTIHLNNELQRDLKIFENKTDKILHNTSKIILIFMIGVIVGWIL